MKTLPVAGRIVNQPLIQIGAAAIPAGLVAGYFELPAGWLVGPMLATLLLALKRPIQVNIPSWVHLGAQAVIGVALSASFTPSSLEVLAGHWAPVLVVVCMVLLLSVLGGLALGRMGGLDPATASLGALPGGAGGMVAMSEDLGADARLVAFLQYTRLVMVVFLASLLAHVVVRIGASPAPPAAPQVVAGAPGEGAPMMAYLLAGGLAVAGAWAGARLRIPAGAMLGPMFLGLALGVFGVSRGALPPGVLQASYLIIGVWVGLRFDRESLRRIRRLAPAVLALGLALIGGCALMGWTLSAVTGIDPLTAYLATTPGGMDSVTIAALESGADTSLVFAVQMMRLLLVIFAGPPLVRWLTRTGVEGTGLRVED